MIDPIMNNWDSMALIPIINGAGGVISDYHGNDPIAGNSIVAASPSLHKEVIKLLNA
jgi:myo-inositol-1(or 4)-monophosphatase